MDAEKQFEAYMKISDAGFACFNARRNYEWKVTLGLWALILLSTQSFLSKPQKLPPCAWTLPVVVMLLHGTWLRGMWKAHRSDKHEECFRGHALAVLNGSPPSIVALPPKTERGRWLEFLWNWAMLFQLLTTLILSSACVFLLQ